MGSIAFPSLIRAGLKSNPMLMLERERSHTVICEDHKEEVISLLFTWLEGACLSAPFQPPPGQQAGDPWAGGGTQETAGPAHSASPEIPCRWYIAAW